MNNPLSDSASRTLHHARHAAGVTCRPPRVARLAVEAASPFGWERWTGERGDIVGVPRFGASAPGRKVLEEYGITVDNVALRALALVSGARANG
ncbi:transketolase-like TK C-terminal-containing protein [Sorangium sp. KYC3313]|uniref:transketolase-like TK C-terminal-containing protein n=1 Tax=Sorangium sp. KYC3313 TaxID=3449740 RepID=UPI003F8A0837